jgi:hypothetical protein
LFSIRLNTTCSRVTSCSKKSRTIWKTVLYPQSNAVLDCFLFQEE